MWNNAGRKNDKADKNANFGAEDLHEQVIGYVLSEGGTNKGKGV